MSRAVKIQSDIRLGRCRACNSGRVTDRYHVAGYPIVACSACGSLTTDAIVTPVLAADFYGHSYYQGGDYADYQASEITLKENFRRFVQQMIRLHKGRRLLELGCAYGFFLDVAQSTWDVAGIDISKDAIEVCKARFGHRVTAGDLLSTQFTSELYDWVVAWDTLEHLDDPRAYARRAFSLVVPGGYLALTTGDVTSLVARLMGQRWRLLTPPSHLTFFSRAGLRRLLEDSGFVDVRIGTAGYARSFEFILFRLLGTTSHNWIQDRCPSVCKTLRSLRIYLNLLDIMFVTARKPAVSTQSDARA